MNFRGEGLGEIVKDLMTQVSCSDCGQNFRAPDIKVIGHEGNVWFLRAYCQTCQRVSLTVAFIGSETEPRKPRRTSDLSVAEKRKFKRHPALSGDDLLDMHGFLEDFDGDFSRLFDKGSKTEYQKGDERD